MSFVKVLTEADRIIDAILLIKASTVISTKRLTYTMKAYYTTGGNTLP